MLAKPGSRCFTPVAGILGERSLIQLILHLIGDYVTQSDWMAQNKTRSNLAALVHALVYSLPFLLIGSFTAWSMIASTHFFIDRFRVARYIVFAKNFMGWPWPPWEDCKATGYPSATPPWMSVWLMIAADNTIHLAINWASLNYL